MKITMTDKLTLTVTLDRPHEFDKKGLEDLYSALIAQLEDHVYFSSAVLVIDDKVELGS